MSVVELAGDGGGAVVALVFAPDDVHDVIPHVSFLFIFYQYV